MMASRRPLLYSDQLYNRGVRLWRRTVPGAVLGHRLDIGGSEEEMALGAWHCGQEASPAPDVHGGLADAQAVERKRAP